MLMALSNNNLRALASKICPGAGSNGNRSFVDNGLGSDLGFLTFLMRLQDLTANRPQIRLSCNPVSPRSQRVRVGVRFRGMRTTGAARGNSPRENRTHFTPSLKAALQSTGIASPIQDL
jgi:hypothetical protein